MAFREGDTPKKQAGNDVFPFENAEEAWFWFIAAQEARNDGARFSAGLGMLPRPCEPLDILKVVDGLYRHRRLLRDHVLVLRHYGRRRLPPDERRVKELRAHTLWHEALERIGAVLERKGIIRPVFDQLFYYHTNQWNQQLEGEALRYAVAAE
jgi:hypothetical protein